MPKNIDNINLNAQGYISPNNFQSFGDGVCPDVQLSGQLIFIDPASTLNKFTYLPGSRTTERNFLISGNTAPGKAYVNTQNTIARVSVSGKVKRININDLMGLTIIKNTQIQDIEGVSTGTSIQFDTTNPNLVLNGGDCQLYNFSGNVGVSVRTNIFPAREIYQDATYRYVIGLSLARRILKSTGVTTGADIVLPNTAVNGEIQGNIFWVGTLAGVSRIDLAARSLTVNIVVPTCTGFFLVHPTIPNRLIVSISAQPAFREIETIGNTLITVSSGPSRNGGRIMKNSIGEIRGFFATAGFTTTIVQTNPLGYFDMGTYNLSATISSPILTCKMVGDLIYFISGTNGSVISIFDTIRKTIIMQDLRFSQYATFFGTTAITVNATSIVILTGNSKIIRLSHGFPISMSVNGGAPVVIPTGSQDIPITSLLDTTDIAFTVPFPGVNSFISCNYLGIGMSV